MRKLPIIFLFALLGCIEEIEFDFQTRGRTLVIDGFVTDQQGPHQIVVSETVPFSDNNPSLTLGISNAQVSIVDSEGETEPLAHIGNGTYITSDSFCGVVGKSYILQVIIGENRYESTPQTIYTPATVDATTFETDIVEFFNDDGRLFETDIVRFSTSMSLPTDSSFVGLTWDATFRWVAPLAAEFRNCWVNEQNRGFSNLIDPNELGLTFENETVSEVFFGLPFSTRYSFNQVTYTYGEETHSYFELVRDQVNSTGSIFDPLPFTIEGNMRNMGDEEEIVLGYFGAFSETQNRIYVNNGDLGLRFTDPCVSVGGPGRLPAFCVACLSYPGAYDQRPDFWID